MDDKVTISNEGTCQVKLSRGMVAVIDADKAEWAKGFRWCVTTSDGKKFYASTKDACGYKNKKMHRLLMDAPPHLQVDHINGDTLDNRLANLRLVNNRENQMNRHKGFGASNYIGVSWDKRRKIWRASTTIYGKQLHLGQFVNEEDAKCAYRLANKIFWMIREATENATPGSTNREKAA